MALKAADLVRFDALQLTASILGKNGFTPEAIENSIKNELLEFQTITKNKARVAVGDDGAVFIELTDLRKDFIRTRKPNDDALVLRTRIQGVPVEIKLFKQEEYDFDNASVVSALRALADEIASVPFRLSELGNSDVRELIELHESVSSDHDIFDGSGELIADVEPLAVASSDESETPASPVVSSSAVLDFDSEEEQEEEQEEDQDAWLEEDEEEEGR